ncbi:hypothetical protein GFS24_06260 [Chitinophaga sp. SYP-B3965]|uniref:sensor histidine kinase n=1 Tax=Chitinophaga sp. SYP-B3965 TaxID=2663120 RepID=UPI001299B973|nr:sensor histidine kinase [Chitinophaga sp. SYP-B3965]MRG44707.1 hypothetical protein [Chitinophaga sp. SYP-B3965]
MRIILPYIFFTVLFAVQSFAAPIVKLSTQHSYQRIGKLCDWYLDKDAKLTLNDVMQPSFQANFSAHEHEMRSYGITNAAVWVHATYVSKERTYLVVEFANIDSISLYYFENGQMKAIASGSHTPLKNKRFNIPGFSFELPSSNGQPKDFWIRVRSGNAVIIPLALATPEGLMESFKWLFVIELMYIGVVLALFFYNLFLFIHLRTLNYLYYLCYLLCFVGFVLIYVRGFHVFLGQTLSYFINMNGISFGAVTYMFAIMFCLSFLNGKKHTPRLRIFLLAFMGVLCLPIICNLAGYRPGAIKILEVCSFLLPISFIYMAIIALRQHYKPAGYFLGAWFVLLMSLMVFAAANTMWLPFLPFGHWTFHILPLASAVEMSLLSLALGSEYAEMKKQMIAAIKKEVTERTKELNESNHVKDKMLGIISHDLRAPLNNLSGLLDLVELKALSAGEIQDFSLTVRQNIKHITGTMNNMLNWSLSQMNRIETRPQKIILYPFILQIIETYWYATDQKNIHLKADIPEGIVVLADLNQLNLIIRNLLDNAIKFTPKGGMILVGCRPSAKTVELYVQDNGMGMGQEEVNKLLSETSFYSTDGTEEEKGTGLGLQLCKEFIMRNGGVLQIRTAPGAGAEFSFSIPRV